MFLVKLTSLLPLRIVYALSEAIAFLLYHVVRYRRSVVRANLLNSFPEKSLSDIKKIERGFYRNFPRVFLEIIKAYRFTNEDWAKLVHLENPETASAYLKNGQPVIMMGGHTANYEFPAFAVGQLLGHPIEYIYKPIDNAYFNGCMLRLRERHGGHAVPKDQALRQIVKRKNVPRTIGIVGDQLPAMGGDKHWTTFLNQETAFYLGAEKIATMVNYPVFYIECQRLKRGRYTLHFHEIGRPPYEKGETGIIDAYVKKLEKTIRANPSDYLWSHKRWKYTKKEEEAHLASL